MIGTLFKESKREAGWRQALLHLPTHGWGGAAGQTNPNRCLPVDKVEAASGRGVVWPWEISVWRPPWCTGSRMSAEHEGQHKTDKCHPMHYRFSRTSMKHEESGRAFPAVPVVSTLKWAISFSVFQLNVDDSSMNGFCIFTALFWALWRENSTSVGSYGS